VKDGGVLVYITVSSISEILPKIEQHGGAKLEGKTLIDEHVGWWASFRDPAGNPMYLYEMSPSHR
jgi:predicted enzyme related to lactoylglutathione lyase